ncbi:YbaN family protein [Selenihalanaerobacter shriftii]|uniref:DUF454 domain-containing protein n=1 Tax=Selenihalanaerobacter shriftii TaxID=142842 RepID=A0A1T4JQP6_9FIRM|nr:YbaN family protein [Selenihalanaerobacter shriftii]SJZ32415.1 hypothetical protein SAMN02745118_00323 [Selenihalanaerobacter shriftii]
MKNFVRILLIIIGSISVLLGIIGVILPVIPTTPFLLLAAICYARSSERFYNWLLSNKLLGRFIKDYREGKGIPLKAKILAISMLWISMGITVIFIIPKLFVKILLTLIAGSVTFYILSIKTYIQ